MEKDANNNKATILNTKTSNLEISHFDKVLHELNTSVHGILNLADILNSNWDGIDEDKKRESIQNIFDSAQTLSSLVKTLKEDSESMIGEAA